MMAERMKLKEEKKRTRSESLIFKWSNFI
jgi:hypothetical protein